MPSKSQNSKIEPKIEKFGTLSSDICKPGMKLRTKKLEMKSNDKFDSNHSKKHLLARIEELEEENRKMSLKIHTLETENQALKQNGDFPFAFESESKPNEIKSEIKSEESEDIIDMNQDQVIETPFKFFWKKYSL